MSLCPIGVDTTVKYFDLANNQKTLTYKKITVQSVSFLNQVGNKIYVSGIAENSGKVPVNNAFETDTGGSQNSSYSLNLVTCTTSIGCGANSPNNQGEAYYQAQIFRDGVNTGLHFTNGGWYSASISKVEYSGKYIEINLGNGTKQRYPANPDKGYTVACGEQCPEGFIKCSCDEYPGYCCIRCDSLLSKLESASASVQRLVKQLN